MTAAGHLDKLAPAIRVSDMENPGEAQRNRAPDSLPTETANSPPRLRAVHDSRPSRRGAQASEAAVARTRSTSTDGEERRAIIYCTQYILYCTVSVEKGERRNLPLSRVSDNLSLLLLCLSCWNILQPANSALLRICWIDGSADSPRALLPRVLARRRELDGCRRSQVFQCHVTTSLCQRACQSATLAEPAWNSCPDGLTSVS